MIFFALIARLIIQAINRPSPLKLLRMTEREMQRIFAMHRGEWTVTPAAVWLQRKYV